MATNTDSRGVCENHSRPQGGRSVHRRLFLRLVVAALVVWGFVACGLFDSDDSSRGTPRLGRLTLVLQIGADGRNYEALGKTSVTLDRIELKLVSAEGSVMHDTITPRGSLMSREPAYLNPSATYPQELQLRYELKPSSYWNVSVRVMDGNDSVRYAGELLVDDLNAFEYLDGCLPVTPRYAVVEGRFRLPAFIESDGVTGSARGLRALYHTRLEILVEDVLLTESYPYDGPAVPDDRRFVTADPERLHGAEGRRFFRPMTLPSDVPVVLTHEYGSAANRLFLVSDYGYIEGDTVGVTPERLLYQGVVNLDLANAKVADESAVPMAWKATDIYPVKGGTGLEVRLGRAGKVIMPVVIPEAIPI